MGVNVHLKSAMNDLISSQSITHECSSVPLLSQNTVLLLQILSLFNEQYFYLNSLVKNIKYIYLYIFTYILHYITNLSLYTAIS